MFHSVLIFIYCGENLQYTKAQEIFSSAIQATDRGIILELIVRPNSKMSGFTGFDQWRKKFEIKVRAPPTQGKANDELITVIAEFFSINPADIEIITGLKSTQKKVLIQNITTSDALEKLEVFQR